MTLFSTAAGIALAFIVSSPSSSSDAFSAVVTSNIQHLFASTSYWRRLPVTFQMSEEECVADDSTVTLNESAPNEQPNEEDTKQKTEILALKESIASLESDLTAKKCNLNNLKDMTEKHSSAGYARQVAIVENNRRKRGANMDDSKSAARASVLQSLLPVLDELDAVGQRYEKNAFAKTLDAGLRSEFEKSLGDLGVSEYVVECGQAVDLGRVVAVEEEHSEEFAKGTVTRPLKSGLEISGNVIRPAEVVGSLGIESADQEEEEEGWEDEGDAGEVLTE